MLTTRDSMEKTYSYIDLFAGCGGLSLGLCNAGWKGLFAIEKSPEAFETLKHNLIDKKKHFSWPDWLDESSLDINDVLKRHEEKLEALRGTVDLVAGGPPCQGFSMIGRREETDRRNGLIGSYLSFIKLVQPKLIFFENVRGFTLEFKKNRDKGKIYSNFVENELVKAGYYVKGKLINFADYGVPQRRTRFILVGIRKKVAGYHKTVVNRFFKMLTTNTMDFLGERSLPSDPNLVDAISDLLQENGTRNSPDTKRFSAGIYARTDNLYQLVMREGVSNQIADSHRFVNHRRDIIEKFSYILKHAVRNKDVDDGIKAKYKIKKHTVLPLDENDKCPTLTTLPDDYIHYSEPRILTVREYARIQTFPDWFEFRGRYTTGGKERKVEVPRYTQIGNAIPPIFGEQSGIVLKRLLK